MMVIIVAFAGAVKPRPSTKISAKSALQRECRVSVKRQPFSAVRSNNNACAFVWRARWRLQQLDGCVRARWNS